jgi:predicted O-methyltransferase YrrM
VAELRGKVHLTGTPDDIMREVLRRCPQAEAALVRSGHIKGQMRAYQAAALYWLARRYDREGARILEVGTFVGYSASVMAQAAPKATIKTLNPALHEVLEAKANLEPLRNVEVLPHKSWEYLLVYDGPAFDLIFVDGDHKRARRDMPLWNWIGVGGLMLFHDYTLAGSPNVVEAVNELGAKLRRMPDVLLLDDQGVGMAGFYRQDRDPPW